MTERPLNALDRHLAFVGFMGAGKTTMCGPVAERLGRPGFDLDANATFLIASLGMDAFRQMESEDTVDSLSRSVSEPSVFALGGGAPVSVDVRSALVDRAFTVLLEVSVDDAWTRVRGSDRPLAQDEAAFRDLHEFRRPYYREVADAVVPSGDLDGVLLAAAGVHHELGALDRLGELVPGDGPVALVADATVMGIHGPRAQVALGDRLQTTHTLPSGEDAKRIAVVERLWSELRLDRTATVLALGGGALTDTAGFAAATYLRGVPWVAVPTTLVGQVDAAIGGKTAIDIPEGKNLVGAFHWPARTIIDPELLETLPEREHRQGIAELVKTRLLAGDDALDARGAAAYKAALCLRDPHDRGPRQWLNLGHTFAHALEAAADFDLPHGEAVALGLLAALRLSNRETTAVEQALDPQPVTVDEERAWQALLRDKKRTGDTINLVLLGDDGPTVEPRSHAEVRVALARLIA